MISDTLRAPDVLAQRQARAQDPGLGVQIPSPVDFAGRPQLAIVIPTYNERGNIPELIGRLRETLRDLDWEIVFVDDDSPDGTADTIRRYARVDPRIRLVHRIGRSGLSTACIEGALTTTAPYIAIMDADMQHDEAILPRMLDTLRMDALDVVIGTRNASGGSMGEFGRSRLLLSRLGQQVSHTVCRSPVSDPMSGFFLFTQSFFFENVHKLHGGGFKILVDMLACADRPVRIGEVGYTFRQRRYGDSKLDVNTGVEYVVLVVDKLIGSVLPVRCTAFLLVGLSGIIVHLACLALLMLVFHMHFVAAQTVAAFATMTENFLLNNTVTWRDRMLRGWRLASGLASFWLVCAFGAWASVVFARSLTQSGTGWLLAGAAGAVLGSVWNYAISSVLLWRMPEQPSAVQPDAAERLPFRADLGAEHHTLYSRES